MERLMLMRGALITGILGFSGWLLLPKLAEVATGNWNRTDSVEVLVASHYIPAFTPIRTNAVRVDDVPKSFVAPGALHKLTELQNDDGQYVFVSAVAIPEGQPMTRTLLVEAGQGETLATLIRPGKVAISFEVDKAHGVGGWIKPGDTIAIFREQLRSSVDAFRHGKATPLLLSSVPVLAVDGNRLGEKIEKPDSASDSQLGLPAVSGDSRILTVLVSPEEAASIVEAKENGHLNVVLRAVGDNLPWPSN